MQISDFALGILQAGETLTLNYDLVLSAIDLNIGTCSYGGCSASAETGAPSDTAGLPTGASIAITGVPVSAVPEPGSLALVALAGAAAGALRRRRRAVAPPVAHPRWRPSP